ncbi:DUF2167 domain-containing protein [Hydrocarboniphaga effusa]|uniref:DUF2167 domain-containing protein n=1 Tax=Hydrocarboniphaga effusa TaxID=243629 RepID=UPI0031378514
MIREFVRACAVVALVFAGCAQAQEQTQQSDPAAAAWRAANEAMQRGPSDVPLKNEATLHLPEGFGFVPREPSIAVMNVMGNQTGDDFIGLVFPIADEEQRWFATLDYTGDGYIEDEEAKNWNADELLDNLKKGTEHGNEFRQQHGAQPIEVTGWVESPAYDAVTHRLVWSVGIKDKGAAASADDGVNYNTYVLGREGYISLNFITSKAAIEAEKPIARQLLAAVEFNQGRSYADFSASTDKIAAYGIGALVGGALLKKAGLFAVAAAFFAKFFKLILVGLAAIGMPLYRKFFKKNSP